MYEITRNGGEVVGRVGTVAQARDRVGYLRAEYPADVFEVYFDAGSDRVHVSV